MPINNLLTFLAGGTITCTDNNSKCSIDSSNFLIICLGEFDEDLSDIIKKRLTGTRQIGFCGKGHEEPDTDDLLQYVTEEDLHEYGIPWEFLGRLSLITRTRQPDISDYKQILTQSDASPVRQYNSLLSNTFGIRISIINEVVTHIANKAGKSNEGARMLSRLVTETLQPAIFDTGKDSDQSGIEIDCNKDGLFTRSEYDMCMNSQNQDNASLFVRAHPDYLSTVPLPCNSSRGEILLFCEKIKKSSNLSWMLPEVYVSAAICTISAAICWQLAYASKVDKNLLTLYRQIDRLPSDCIPHPSSNLEQMINEFIQKAQKDIPLEKAKTNARSFIVDYCKNYSVYEPQFNA